MTLYSETSGRGADVVLLHGWGWNSGVWQDAARELAREFRVTTIDLPGHGRSRALPVSYTLEEMSQRVLQNAPPQAHWIGWSLGGTLALHIAASHPRRVKKLVLVASTPKFIAAPDWPHGVEPEVLGQFADQLRTDYRKTLQRFLALQLRGSDVPGRAPAKGSANVAGGRACPGLDPGTPGATEHAAACPDRNGLSAELRRLRAVVFRYGEPQATALHAGLDILRSADLRPRLAAVSRPILLIAGARDMLAPLSAHEYMAAHLARAGLQVIPGAAHVPFLTHPGEFQRALRAFLHD